MNVGPLQPHPHTDGCWRQGQHLTLSSTGQRKRGAICNLNRRDFHINWMNIMAQNAFSLSAPAPNGILVFSGFSGSGQGFRKILPLINLPRFISKSARPTYPSRPSSERTCVFRQGGNKHWRLSPLAMMGKQTLFPLNQAAQRTTDGLTNNQKSKHFNFFFKKSEYKSRALFTDLEFRCDETPSVSYNREVVPRTGRHDSLRCRLEIPLNRNA